MPTALNRARLTRIVQSRQNARVKELRAAFTRAARTAGGLLAIEGEHLLLEAIASRDPVRAREMATSHLLGVRDRRVVAMLHPVTERR